MSEQPKKVKTNFLAKPMQHFVLDPIKTPAEADKRIKEILPVLGGAFAGVILFILLGNWIEPVKWLFNILGYLCMAVVFVFGFFFYKAFTNKKRLQKLMCDGCKEVMGYDAYMGHSINEKASGLHITDHKEQKNDGNFKVSVSANETKTFHIRCRCPKCGAEKEISQLFTMAKVKVLPKTNIHPVQLNLVLGEMRAAIQNAYKDNHFAKASEYGVSVEMCQSDEKAIVDFFTDDGSASNTPIGKVTKTPGQD